MNKKRIYLIVLIISAAAAVAAVVFYFLWPGISGPTPSKQPPAQTSTPPAPFDPSRPPTLQPPTGSAPDINDPAEQERQAEEALKRQALDFAGRQGSYSNANDFVAIRQAYPQSTTQLATFLESQRQELINTYPSYGAPYGRTMRSLSANITAGQPILNGTAATVEVQTQVVTNNTNGSSATSYVKVTIEYIKSGDVWMADHIQSEPLPL